MTGDSHSGMIAPSRESRRGFGPVALVVVAAGGVLWLFAAALLWRTTVPDDLRLPELDQRAFFGERLLERSSHFERFLRVDWALATVAELAALAVFAWRGPRLARGLPVGRIGKGLILGLVLLTILWAVGLPFGIAAQWWERRYGLSDAGYLEWLLAPWAELPVLVLSTCLLIAIVMALAGSRLGRYWWLPGAAVFAGIVAALTFVSPYIVPVGDTERVRGSLAQDARTLERREGVGDIPVDVEDVDDLTEQANAYATGFGPTSHVFLWNTLTDGPFSRAEIRVVLAHELAHVARNHILRGLAWFALVMIALAFVVEVATRRLGGIANPASIPLAALVLVAAQLVLLPFSTAISRRYEAEADWIALTSTKEPRAARRLFARFTRTSLQQPNPPTWDYVLLEDHPTIMQRIAMAEAYRKREQAR